MFNDEKTLRLQVSWQRIKDQVAPSCNEYAWKVRQRMAHDTNPLWNRISDTVEAQAFAGVSRLERQRMVNRALGDLPGQRIHALAIRARAPGE